MKLLSCLVLTTVVAALAPAARADEVSRADAQRFVDWFDKLVDRVIGDGHNCPKITADINSMVDGAKDLFAMAQKAKAEGKKLPADLLQHVEQSAGRMIQSMGPCIQDKTVQIAFHRMDIGAPPAHH